VSEGGLLLITLYGLGIVSTAALVAVPTALFLAVYLGAMVAAARVLHGPVRLAALPAALAVVVNARVLRLDGHSNGHGRAGGHLVPFGSTRAAAGRR
jgi:hypothetical protein